MTEKKEKAGVEGILGGLTDLVEKLGELAEKGERLSRTGEFQWGGGERKGKGVFGFSVKMGLGEEGVKVEPFGNVRRDEATGRSVVHETREPIVDVFEEKDHVLVVAEMPGVEAEDVRIEVADDILVLKAERGDKKYSKEVLLPVSVRRDGTTAACKNGIVEIKALKH